MLEYVNNENIDMMLGCLDDDIQIIIIISFYGLDGQPRKKIERIAENIGISREETYAIYQAAMAIFRSEKVVITFRNKV